MTDKTQHSASEKSTRKTVRFFWLCSGLLLAIIAVFAFAFQFEFFSAGPHVVFAMAAGVFFTILLGVGLMALAFHSDESGIDDNQS